MSISVIKMKVKDKTDESPGSWHDSAITFKAKGSKWEIEKIQRYITKAIKECCNS